MWHALIDVICNTCQHPPSLRPMKEKKASSNPDSTSTVEAKPPAAQRCCKFQSWSDPSSRTWLLHSLPSQGAPPWGPSSSASHQPPLQQVPNHSTSLNSRVARTAANCCLFTRNSLFSPIIPYKTSLDNLKT